MCHNWLRERLYAAEIVAASSYQKDGRPAPARLTTEANAATITGSSAAGGGVSRSRRTVAIRRLEYPLITSPWCQKRWVRWRRPGIGQLPRRDAGRLGAGLLASAATGALCRWTATSAGCRRPPAAYPYCRL